MKIGEWKSTLAVLAEVFAISSLANTYDQTIV